MFRLGDRFRVCDSVWCEFTVPVIVDFKEIVSEVKVSIDL